MADTATSSSIAATKISSLQRVIVVVEVCVRPSCLLPFEDIRKDVIRYLETFVPVFRDGATIFQEKKPLNFEDDTLCSEMSEIIESIRICDVGYNKAISFWQAEVVIHCYRNSENGPERDFIEGEQDDLPSSEQWELPNKYFDGLWESIILDDQIKQQLLGYTSTSLLFSEALLDPAIISWNRMILLHGPPGTGKTTLCKALANKLAIRYNSQYQSSVLMEINSHSLFSKWFSESGKLVMKLFDQITELAEDESCLVLVLIDEVESITASRKSSASEPGDAIRVVNAVLTSLDALKRKNNVLVLTTSNLLETIDSAFKDRLDMQVYLGPPNLVARYEIIKTCVMELMKRGVIEPIMNIKSYHEYYQEFFQADTDPLDRKDVTPRKPSNRRGVDVGDVASPLSSSRLVPRSSDSYNHDDQQNVEDALYIVAQTSEGFSGRKLRKLPLQAHAMFLRRRKTNIRDFLDAMNQAVLVNSD